MKKWRIKVRGPDGKEFEDECDVFVNAGGQYPYLAPVIPLTHWDVLQVSSTLGNGPISRASLTSRAYFAIPRVGPTTWTTRANASPSLVLEVRESRY